MIIYRLLQKTSHQIGDGTSIIYRSVYIYHRTSVINERAVFTKDLVHMINGTATMQKIVLGDVHYADIGKIPESGSLFCFLLGHSGGVIATPSDMIIVIRLLDKLHCLAMR